MRVEEKELALKQLLHERFADDRLTRNQRIARALCGDRDLGWVVIDPDPELKVEQAEADIEGEPVAAIRRTMSSGGGFSTLDLRVVETKRPGDAGRGFSFVEKRITRPAPSERGHSAWLDEALFYADIQPELAGPGFHIPSGLLLRAHDDGSYSLCLEEIPGLERPFTVDARYAASRALGQLAAVACLRNIGARAWLSKRRVKEKLAASGAAAECLGRLECLDAVDRDTLRNYERIQEVLSRAVEVQETFARTVRHNDTHSGNVLLDPQGKICILDWARVSSGLLGEDLCQLFQPWIYAATEFSTMEELEQVEEGLLDAYASSVKEVLPACNREEIRLNYYVRSLVHSLNRLNGRNKSMRKFLGQARDDRTLAARVGLYYAYTSRKVAACRDMM